MGLALTTRLIQLEEGCRLTAYKDSRGIWTIGYGYNLEAHGFSPDECVGLVWTQEEADEHLADEIQTVLRELDRRWPKWRDLDEVRQAAIVSSVYQLGAPGAAKFVSTIRALVDHNWSAAAVQMSASRWAQQTPARVMRNAEMIRTGSWPKEVSGERFLPDPPAAAADVASASAQPGACLLPTVLPSTPWPRPGMEQPVGADLPDRARVVAILIALSKSKTIWGVVGLVGSQLLGATPWDMAVRISGTIYTIPDLSPYFHYLQPAFVSLAVWGRITAKPIEERSHA